MDYLEEEEDEAIRERLARLRRLAVVYRRLVVQIRENTATQESDMKIVTTLCALEGTLLLLEAAQREATVE